VGGRGTRHERRLEAMADAGGITLTRAGSDGAGEVTAGEPLTQEDTDAALGARP